MMFDEETGAQVAMSQLADPRAPMNMAHLAKSHRFPNAIRNRWIGSDNYLSTKSKRYNH
jgi:hypothetical protein